MAFIQGMIRAAEKSWPLLSNLLKTALYFFNEGLTPGKKFSTADCLSISQRIKK